MMPLLILLILGAGLVGSFVFIQQIRALLGVGTDQQLSGNTMVLILAAVAILGVVAFVFLTKKGVV